MSQLSKVLLQGSSVQGFQPTIGPRVYPVNNKIYIFGDGINIFTTASGNTISASLYNDIVIDSSIIGSITTSGNSISVPINTNLTFVPDGNGRVSIPYAAAYSALITNTLAQVASSAALQDGQLIIGQTGSLPVAANLTAGQGISIVNAPGSITISAQPGGSVGATQWQTNTWTGSGNRNYTAYPNNGYFANSNVGTLSSPNYYCPSSPIRYTFASSNQWNKGDYAWFANRNKGNFSAQFLNDQWYLSSNLIGAGIASPRQAACLSSANLDTRIDPGSAQRSLTRSYGASLVIYLGTVNFNAGSTRDSNGSYIHKTYDNVFILANTVGAPSGCNTNCLV